MTVFTETQPTLDNYWRSIILFGRNVASYKFALGKSLLELSPKGSEVISLRDLAEPFSRHLCRHLKDADKQATSPSSKFLQTCRRFNAGKIEKDELLEHTIRLGFNNVIDAFHVVHDGETPVRFFHDERKGKEKGIRLTQDLFALTETFQFQNLPSEVEARWRLVETAWALDLSTNVLRADPENDDLLVEDRHLRRKSITSCRHALNGYQKGKCFYCFGDVSVESASEICADVDHFFPHALKQYDPSMTVDGVWNLVLACKGCNRGTGGKSAKIPEPRLLERLHRRNSFLIDSQHPLRETLQMQTGNDSSQRQAFLQNNFNRAKSFLLHTWSPENEHEPAF